MNKQWGFTLVELLITMAIVVIVLTVGVPSFQQMIRNNKIIAQTNDFLGAYNFARSEAIKRGQRVVMCPSNNGTNCVNVNWDQGWIVFVDADNNAAVGNAATEPVLRVQDQFDTTTDQFGNNNTLTGTLSGDNFISFIPAGYTRGTGGGFQMGTLSFGLCNSNNQRNDIVINAVGRAQVVRIPCP